MLLILLYIYIHIIVKYIYIYTTIALFINILIFIYLCASSLASPPRFLAWSVGFTPTKFDMLLHNVFWVSVHI